MFCSYCGNPLPEDAAFCVACGKAQQENTFQTQKAQVRQSEMGVLSAAIAHFSQKKMQYERYDEVCRQLKERVRGSSNALIIWGAILFGIALLFTAVVSENMMAEDVVPLVLFCLMPLIGSIAMIVGGILKKVAHARGNQALQQEYMQLSVELYGHFLNHAACPVGPEYTNPIVLTHLMYLIQSGHADTVKESLNLAVGKAGWGVSRYLENVARLTADINIRTGVPAIFVAANLFK